MVVVSAGHDVSLTDAGRPCRLDRDPMLVAFLTTLAVAGASVADAESPVTIDGHLDEPSWARAEPVDDFARFIPTEGGAPPGHTEVRFL